jgi:DNA-binding protein YbaB
LSLDPSVAQAATAEARKLLEDLVVGAINVALDRGRELARQEMSKLTGGFPVPPGAFG